MQGLYPCLQGIWQGVLRKRDEKLPGAVQAALSGVRMNKFFCWYCRKEKQIEGRVPVRWGKIGSIRGHKCSDCADIARRRRKEINQARIA
jgi:hypothetical protein